MSRPNWIRIATGRVSQVTALIAAIGALVLLILNQWEQIQLKLIAMKLLKERACVEISQVVIPKAVNYRDWDSMRIKVKGRNNCDEPLGLYVTFLRRASDARFVLRVPHEDLPECAGVAPVLVPRCWDPKKPVASGKGVWEWNTLPPPLSQLSAPRPTETLSFTWDVRNVDGPGERSLATASAQIEVANDRAQP